MTHPILSDFELIKELDYVKFFSNAARDTFIVEHKELTTVSAEMARESIAIIDNYKNGNTIYAITDASAQFLEFTTEAKNHYKNHVIDAGIVLNAIVVKDVTLKIIANLYARFDRPKVPSRVFTSIKDAVDWIEEAKS